MKAFNQRSTPLQAYNVFHLLDRKSTTSILDVTLRIPPAAYSFSLYDV